VPARIRLDQLSSGQLFRRDKNRFKSGTSAMLDADIVYRTSSKSFNRLLSDYAVYFVFHGLNLIKIVNV